MQRLISKGSMPAGFIIRIKASMAEMYWELTKTIWIPVGIRGFADGDFQIRMMKDTAK